MQKHKMEIILIIILIPIIGYVGWQVYNTYFKPQDIDIEELRNPEPVSAEPPAAPAAETKDIPKQKGTLNYAGYISRDPLSPSLPAEKKENIPAGEKPPEKNTAVRPAAEKKEIVLPVFNVTGIVWGSVPPRAIIDGGTCKTGDIVKGAKILEITQRGIHMVYEGKEFWEDIGQ